MTPRIRNTGSALARQATAAFSTGGFNEWHVLAITQSICRVLIAQGIDGPVVPGHRHARLVGAGLPQRPRLTANGVTVCIAVNDDYTPTPAVSHAILTFNRGRKSGLADGIVITPSHNPPADGGFKDNPPHGGPANDDVTSFIEREANALLGEGLTGVRRTPDVVALRAATTRRHDFLNAYVADLASVVDLAAAQRRPGGWRLTRSAARG